MFRGIKKIVYPKVFGCMRQVCQTKVQTQYYENGYQIEPFQWFGSGEDDFKEGIGRINCMLRCVGPERKR